MSVILNNGAVVGGSLVINFAAAGTPTPTPTTTPTPTVTHTVSITPTITPTLTFTPTITPTVGGSLTITTSSSLSATVGTSFSQSLVATGGSGGYAFSIVSCSPNSGGWLICSGSSLLGTPQMNEVETAVVQVTDSSGSTAQKTISVTVSVTGSLSVTSSTTLPAGDRKSVV